MRVKFEYETIIWSTKYIMQSDKLLKLIKNETNSNTDRKHSHGKIIHENKDRNIQHRMIQASQTCMWIQNKY